MKISVFGTGYVGLVQGAVLADAGHQVTCVDVNEKKLQDLREGVIPIFEPGLESIVKSAFADGRLVFTSDAAFAVQQADIHFIAVGTPPGEDGSADLRHVLAVAKTIATHLRGYAVIVDKSTVPVGTADRVAEVIAQTLKEQGAEFAFDVVSNPEFLKEGAAVADCQRPDRIVIWTHSVKAEALMRELYEPFNRNHDKIIVMSPRSAEMTKYAANCMLATRISLMNELAIVAEGLGADIESVRQGIGSDQRIGYHFIYAGAGYGGSCFPKDISALVTSAQQIGMEPFILNAVEARNQAQKRVIFEKLKTYFQGDLRNKVIAVWGLAFKPNTDDM
ncbi:MAG: UDP-glucose dehydrogenase family protein, partial [Rhodoferax sp.]